MRGSAALRLGDLRARRAVPALVRNLGVRNDLDRNAAVIALGKIKDASTIAPLIEVAGEDEAAAVRVNAIVALAALGDARGVEMLVALAVDPLPLIVTCERTLYFRRRPRRSYRRWLRRWAAKRLRELRPAGAAALLEAALSTHHPLRWRGRSTSFAKVTTRNPLGREAAKPPRGLMWISGRRRRRGRVRGGR